MDITRMIYGLVAVALCLYSGFLCYRFNVIKSTSRQRTVVAMDFALMVNLIGYIEEITVTAEEASKWAVRLRYIGMIWFALFLFLLMYDMCEFKKKKLVRFILTLSGMILTVAVVIDQWFEHMFAFDGTLDGYFAIQAAYSTKGAGIAVCSIICLCLVASVVLSIYLAYHNRRMITMIVANVFCLLAAPMQYIYGKGITQGIDPSVIAALLAIQHILITNKNYHVLDDGSVAQQLILDEAGDGYIVLDYNHRVKFFNNIALMLYPELGYEDQKNVMAELMYLHNHECFEHNGKKCDLVVSELKEFGDVTGYVIWLYDRTDEYNAIGELNRLQAEVDESTKIRELYARHMSRGMNSPICIIKSRGQAIYGDENSSNDIREMASEIIEQDKKIDDMSDVLMDYTRNRNPEEWPAYDNYDTGELLEHIQGELERRKGGRLAQTSLVVTGSLPTRWYGSLEAVEIIIDSVLRLSGMVSIPESIDVTVSMEARYSDALLVMTVYLADQGSITGELERISTLADRANVPLKEEVNFIPYDLIQELIKELNGTVEWSVIGNESKVVIFIPQRIVGEENYNLDAVGQYATPGESARQEATADILREENLHNAEPVLTGVDKVDMTGMSGSSSAPVLSQMVAFDFSKKYAENDKKPIVLLVDDNTLYLREMDGWLRKLGVRTIVTKSGMEAVEVYRKKQIDLIFMDHMMPVMDGTETLVKIREIEHEAGKGIRVPVILLTADDTVGARKKYLNRGFDDYISKPVEPHEIENMIKTYLPEVIG